MAVSVAGDTKGLMNVSDGAVAGEKLFLYVFSCEFLNKKNNYSIISYNNTGGGGNAMVDFQAKINFNYIMNIAGNVI